MPICCEHPDYKLIEELGHVESVDWDLGRCAACGSYLLAQWSEYAPASTSYDALTQAEGDELKASQGRRRFDLLKRWYADH
jgi:hypothetical protein